MKFKVTAPFGVPTGTYTGTILGVEYRDNPYNYTDFIVEVDLPNVEMKPTLKVGFPSFVSTDSNLGNFLSKFTSITIGIEVDPEVVTKSKRVKFDVANMPGTGKNKDKTYANIVPSTIKPI